MQRRHLLPLALALASALAVPLCAAQNVAMTGAMGAKALLVIDGKAPRALGAGDLHLGVRVLRVTANDAVIETAGKRHTVVLGAAPVKLGGSGAAGGTGTRISLSVGPGGHFTTSGNINGGTVQFMVDTGASVIAMGEADAERLGLDYRKGKPLQVGTANGVSMARGITLASVRIQNVELRNVEAVVTPQPMPFVLLGNSFLSRFSMLRESDTLMLTKRF